MSAPDRFASESHEDFLTRGRTAREAARIRRELADSQARAEEHADRYVAQEDAFREVNSERDAAFAEAREGDSQ